MRILLVGLLPIVALTTLWALLALRGRPPKRYAVNAVLGLVVLGYFGVTAALGLFWVARQELPVFEPHYLSGYLTIVLVGTHVAVNTRQLLKFARQNAPRSLVEKGTGEFRWPVRALGLVAVALVFGGACFALGRARGSLAVVVHDRPPAPRDATERRANALAAPAEIAEQLVTVGKQDMTVAAFYHAEASASQAGTFAVSRRPDPFKSYPGAPTVVLPKEFVRAPVSTTQAIEQARSPVAALYPKAVTKAELATVLQMTDGLTGSGRADPNLGLFRARSAPSAGALYPTDIYVVAENVVELPAGIYYYDARENSLALVRAGEQLGALANITSSPALVRNSSFALVLTTEYARESFKYGVRSYRFDLLDAGHIAENALVAARYIGLATLPLGRFDDLRLDALLGVEAARESALLVLPFGRPLDAATQVPFEWQFEAAPTKLESAEVPTLISTIHGRTMLSLAGGHGERVQPYPPPAPTRVLEDTGGRVKLPAFSRSTDDLFATLLARRTIRTWSSDGMSSEQLATVLAASFGETAGERSPTTEGRHASRAYVVALRVKGLEPGVYLYDGAANELAKVPSGRLLPGFPSAADVVIVHSAAQRELASPDGSRGYRYAAFDVGMASERLYLATVATGLGANAIGSFPDGIVARVIGAAASDEFVMQLTALGAVPGGRAP